MISAYHIYFKYTTVHIFTVLSSEDADLLQAYNHATQSLQDFRSYHIQIVSKYVPTYSLMFLKL